MQSGHQYGKGSSVGVNNSMNRLPGDSSNSFGTAVVAESGRNKFRKGERSRRMWTDKEEDILAASLLELTATGWKSDNGFRAGYLSKIEDSLRAEFPNTDLKGNPHINSKMQAWKKSYGSLRLILSRSGVGFNNNGDYKIDCSDDQWDQIVQADKEAKFMRNKSWPLWETWKAIFGKSRASGGGAEQLQTAAVRLRAEASGGSQVNENDYHPSFEDFIPKPYTPVPDTNEANENSSGTTGKQPSTTKASEGKGKKRSRDSELMDFLGNLHAETNSRLEMIASRIGYEFDMGKALQEIFEKLGTVEGLTLAQRYKLCNILGDKHQRLEVFTGMRTDARLGYLLSLIDDEQRLG